MKNVQVTYAHKRPPYWEITASDGRWWSVAFKAGADKDARYTIVNNRGLYLDPWGPTGQKLLDVVHNYERNTPPR